MFNVMKSKCYVIAEIGQNHQGDVQIAKTMISLAKECGADCVKFQKSDLVCKFNKRALERPYSSPHSWGETYGEHKAFLELSKESYKYLQRHAAECGIDFTASAMDSSSLEFIHSLGVPFIKIGSGDAENATLLRLAASLDTPILISTGMCSLESVKAAYEIVASVHNNFAIMHCVSSYPTPVDQINLNVIRTYKNIFPSIAIGYSGHENGIEHTITAVKLGARVVERHFTLDKTWKGSDHSCSLTPSELSQLVKSIREVEGDPAPKIHASPALGSFEKTVQKSEAPCIAKLGKTLVAQHALTKGTVLTAEDISVKVAEPKGIPCKNYDSVLGRVLLRDIAADESIFWDDLKPI